jgi:signal transduction histidine kinase/ligand-binding sensor domain-containing protein/DNA-binding response OmpR family regulator
MLRAVTRAAARIRRSIALLVVAAGGATAAARADTGFAAEHWTVNDGLPVNSVTAIAQSRSGYLWLATFDGLARFDGARFVVLNTANSSGLPTNRIVDLMEAGDGVLWLVGEGGRLIRFAGGVFSAEPDTTSVVRLVRDGEGGIWFGTATGVLHYTHGRLDPFRPDRLRTRIEAIVRDRGGAVWCAGENGVARLDGDRLTTWTAADGLSATSAKALLEDADGSMLVGTVAGLDRMTAGGVVHVGATRPYISSLTAFDSPSVWVGSDAGVFELAGGSLKQRGPAGRALSYHGTIQRLSSGAVWFALGDRLYRDGTLEYETGARVTALLEDTEHSIWIATDGGGLHRLRPSIVTTIGGPEGVRQPNVYPVFEDRAGTIWTATANQGLVRIDDTRVTNLGGGPGGLPLLARAFAEDAGGHLYVGSLSGGVCVMRGASCQPITAVDPYARASVYALAFDRAGTLWVGTDAGLYRRNTDGDWRSLTPEIGLPRGTVRVVVPAGDGAVWIGTNGGGVARVAGTTVELISTREGLPSDLIRAIHVDARGIVWVGTEDRGLARLARRADGHGWDITSIQRARGLFDDTIHAILEDDRDRLWMSTNRGVFFVARRDLDAPGRAVLSTGFTERDGMRNREANGGFQPMAIRARDGRLWFPTQAGLAVFDLSLLTHNDRPPPVVVEAARLNGRDLEIDYSALTFVKPENIRFEYRLDDAAWTDAGNRRTAFFTNLPAGRHRFQVAAANSDGVWNRAGASLEVAIAPFVYERAWFRAGAVLALGLVVFGAWRWRVRRLTARQAELEAIVDERTREVAAQAHRLLELDKAKSAFFANVSHEFRTPLTLTIGPLQDLRAGVHGALTSAAARDVDSAIDNSRRLLKLVNEILDLSRLESGNLALRRRPTDMTALLGTVALGFTPAAERRGITLVRDLPAAPVVMGVDPEQIERVVANVIGNAVKYTPGGGTVTLAACADAATGRFVIRVTDSGPGIAAADLPRVFERFYRAADAGTAALPGTGIGLSLAKDLIELHGGTIQVESGEGRGATFVMSLPAGEMSADLPAPAAAETAGSDAAGRPAVLVVDDHADIRAWIRSRFEDAYRVIEAADGQAAIELARSATPDVIISDVAMPRMDGFELVRALKRDSETDFIPVILLTARAADGDRPEGLERGADDYLVKPFSMPELLVRVRNLIESRKRLRARVLAAAPGESPFRPATVDVPSSDDAFLELVRSTIEQRLADPSLSVETLAVAVGQSRSNLYRRLQELSGESPAEVIRSMRLERASQLLAARAGTVGEIAYGVGFESLSHFSRAFRAKYGVSPSVWAVKPSANS